MRSCVLHWPCFRRSCGPIYKSWNMLGPNASSLIISISIWRYWNAPNLQVAIGNQTRVFFPHPFFSQVVWLEMFSKLYKQDRCESLLWCSSETRKCSSKAKRHDGNDGHSHPKRAKREVQQEDRNPHGPGQFEILYLVVAKLAPTFRWCTTFNELLHLVECWIKYEGMVHKLI